VKNVEVLLREHVEDLGRCGDVVKVRPGFARNYLFPRNLAVKANEDNKRLMQRRRVQLDLEEAARNQELEAQLERLSALAVATTMKADEHGHLYGSVSAGTIAELVRAAGFDLDEDDVRLDVPIKEVGTHRVRVHLHGERHAEIAVEVRAEGA
jgi:large subunit ribosomal protein L9